MTYLFTNTTDHLNPSKTKNRKRLKEITTDRAASANRWKGANPVITVEDVFVQELQGVYEIDPEQLNIPESKKNPDGTLIDDGGLFQGWSTYDWKSVE